MFVSAVVRRRVVALVSGAVLCLAASDLVAQQSPGMPRPSAPGSPAGGAPGIAQPVPQTPSPPSTGLAVVRGRIVRSDGGAPLRRARVTLSLDPFQVLTVQTDDDGRYELTGLTAGRYTATVSKAGYVTQEYGQRHPRAPGQPLEIANGAIVDRVDFSMTRGGAIEGHVLDEAGEPAAGVGVQVLRHRYVNGHRQLMAGGGTSAVTDDLGRFRVHGIPPGEYYLAATAMGSGTSPRSPVLRVPGSATTFYPATASPTEAQQLVVDALDLTGLTLQLVPVRAATLSGVVTARGGGQPVRANVSLSQNIGPITRSVSAAPDGAFSFTDLAPGDYIVTVQNPAASLNETESGRASVSLNGSDISVVVALTRGQTARGRIVFDGGAPPPNVPASSFRLLFMPLEATGFPAVDRPAAVSADWTFEASSLFNRVRLNTRLPAGWHLKSIRRNGSEISDGIIDVQKGDVDDIEVVVTQRTTELSGTVADAPDVAAAGSTVLVFADDRQLWGFGSRYVRAVRADTNGTYTIGGLPPSRYVAVALDFLEEGDETDPDYLDSLRRLGTPFALRDGEMRALDLRLEVTP